MVRILATSVAALSIMATAAVAQDGHDAFVNLCLANREAADVRAAVIADGWIVTSEEIGQQTQSLLSMTTEVWTKPSGTASTPARFIAFGRIPASEYGSTLPADVCFVVAPGIRAAEAAASIEQTVGIAPNAGEGAWMVSRNDQGFQAEPSLVEASPEVVAEAAATRGARMLAAIPGNGLAIYLQMMPVSRAD